MLYQRALWKQSNYLTVLYNATVCASSLPSVGTKMGTMMVADVDKEPGIPN